MDVMTLFFMKSSGEITAFCTGTQDMSYFGDLASDYSVIMDFIVVPYDKYVLDNLSSFCIDLASREILFKGVISKYKTV